MSRVLLNAARIVANTQPAARTFASTTVNAQKTTGSIWLGDKGAWPVMGIMMVAVSGCGAFMARKVIVHPDVRVSSAKRNADIRDWN